MSAVLQDIFETVPPRGRLSRSTDGLVAILGESGTGKENWWLGADGEVDGRGAGETAAARREEVTKSR